MKLKVAIGPSSFASQDSTPIRLLEEVGIEIVPNPFGRRLTEEEIIKHLEGVDGLIAGLEPLNKKVLQSNARLKVVARVGIGMTNVDQEAAKELSIKVSNTPDGPTRAVAEMTITALLSLCRNLVSSNNLLHEGKWEKSIGIGLYDTKVLIIGYGRIGKEVSKLLSVFGAQVLVFDPNISKGDLIYNERIVNLDEGLSQAEVVSLHASGTEVIIGESEFEKMNDGVILLNSARGELVEEDALIQALDKKKIKVAWFDAFWNEPYNGKLTKYDQVLLTPHIGTYTKQCRKDMEVSAVKNLLRDLGVEV